MTQELGKLEQKTFDTLEYGIDSITQRGLIFVDFFGLERVKTQDGQVIQLDIAGKKYVLKKCTSEEEAKGWYSAHDRILSTKKFRIYLGNYGDHDATIIGFPERLAHSHSLVVDNLPKIYDFRVTLDEKEKIESESETFSPSLAKRIRGKTNLSPTELAASLGISVPMLHVYESKGINRLASKSRKYLTWLKTVSGYNPLKI